MKHILIFIDEKAVTSTQMMYLVYCTVSLKVDYVYIWHEG